MKDPLEQFRKTPLKTSAALPPKGPEQYVAFEAKDKVERLKIRRANDPTRTPGYDYLLDVICDELYGLSFVLVYTYMVVLVRGKNLQGISTALQMGTCDFIQEYDSDRWEMPQDEKTPFIESIEVEVQEAIPPGRSESDTVH